MGTKENVTPSGPTPGPWALSRCRTDATIRVVTLDTLTATRSTVAECGPIGHGRGDTFKADDEGYANARLIAAAPELLAFVEKVAKVECYCADFVAASGPCEACEARGLLAQVRP